MKIKRKIPALEIIKNIEKYNLKNNSESVMNITFYFELLPGYDYKQINQKVDEIIENLPLDEKEDNGIQIAISFSNYINEQVFIEETKKFSFDVFNGYTINVSYNDGHVYSIEERITKE